MRLTTKLSRAAQSVNRERGTESVIGGGSGELGAIHNLTHLQKLLRI